ncbi:MAG TPA: hypothetical protein VGM03_09675 [Phycisphaerae bacterium]|jgi:hypothetical protein
MTSLSQRNSPANHKRRVFVSVFLALLSGVPVYSQIPRQAGTALDASNRIGSGSINTGGRRDYYPGGNFFVTGNVTGGAGFRGFSPIRDASALQISLPSASLSGFQSNSLSVQNIVGNRTSSAGPSPFFLPSQTASFGGGDVLSLANRPLGGALYSPPQPGFGPSGRLGVSGFNSSILDSSLGTFNGFQRSGGLPSAAGFGGLPGVPGLGGSPVGPQLLGSDRYNPFGSSANAPLRSSGVPDTSNFGVLGRGLLPDTSSLLENPVIGTPSPGAQGPLFGPQRTTRDVLNSTPAAIAESRYSRGLNEMVPQRVIDPLTGQLRLHEPSLAGTLNQPSDSPGSASGPEPRPAGSAQTTGASAVAPSILKNPLAGAGTAGRKGASDTRTPGAERLFRPTGNDVFGDVQGALRWLDSVRPRRHVAASGALETSPERLAGTPSALDPDSITGARRLVAEPLTTYAGAAAGRGNEYIRRAEDLVRKGEYYRAARNYETAAALDRGNPLIDLGWGHALVGAGEYSSAVHHLLRGLERYPDLVRLNIDLSQFIPDVRVLDERRIDLEQRLAQQENPELRFLLGYLEYYGGLRQFGLEHLKRAAAEATPDSVIARIPDLLSENPLEGLAPSEKP